MSVAEQQLVESRAPLGRPFSRPEDQVNRAAGVIVANLLCLVEHRDDFSRVVATFINI